MSGDRGRPRGEFAPRSWSGKLPATLEGIVAAAVIGGVLGVVYMLIQMPGLIVVRIEDDAGGAVRDAQVVCFFEKNGMRLTGLTDVFGEAKWPGLERGVWSCDATLPDRYFSPPLHGNPVVEPRRPAFWRAKVERPAHVVVAVGRPKGAPRAQVQVRAVCPAAPGRPAASWEAKSGLLDGQASLFLPHGQECAVGIVRPTGLRRAGPAELATLECDRSPCSPSFSAGVGETKTITLAPTAAQWEAARPAPEPDEQAAPIDAGAPEGSAPPDGGQTLPQ